MNNEITAISFFKNKDKHLVCVTYSTLDGETILQMNKKKSFEINLTELQILEQLKSIFVNKL